MRAPDEYVNFAERVLFVALVAAVAIAVYKLATVLLVVAGAITFAAILRLFADPLRKRFGLGSKISVLIVLAGLAVVVAIFATVFGLQLSNQINQLAQSLPDSIATLRERLSKSAIGETVLTFLERYRDEGPGLGALRRVTTATLSALALLLVILVMGVIFAFYPERYREGFLSLLPQGKRPRWRDAFNATGESLKGWMMGMLVSMTLIGILVSLGLMMIGMEAWLALGFIAGLAEFVPIIGPFVSAIPGLVVAATDGLGMFLKALAVYVIVQQLESDVITPLVMRKAVRLPMPITLVSVIAFGTLFGLPGAILATPIAVVVTVLVRRLYIKDVLGEKA